MIFQKSFIVPDKFPVPFLALLILRSFSLGKFESEVLLPFQLDFGISNNNISDSFYRLIICQNNQNRITFVIKNCFKVYRIFCICWSLQKGAFIIRNPCHDIGIDLICFVYSFQQAIKLFFVDSYLFSRPFLLLLCVDAVAWNSFNFQALILATRSILFMIFSSRFIMLSKYCSSSCKQLFLTSQATA